jgi:protein-tyrosine phosphatase
MIQVLFICMGNICRSPTAEGVFRHHIQKLGIKEGYHGDIYIDSAGTTSFHTGHEPDPRSTATAALHGIDLSGIQSRQVSRDDFEDYDYILAMDHENVKNLKKIGAKEFHHKIHLFMHFAKGEPALDEVPDPYYGEGDGFTYVYEIVDRASLGLIEHLQKNNEI